MTDAVLRIVLYFDVFSWPLTRPEVARFVAPGAPGEVDAACDALVARGVLCEQGSFVFTPGREAAVAARQAANARAEQLWPDAHRAAAVLARLPFVRAVLVTGGLSKNAADAEPDVDFLLVVEPGRVWTTKTAIEAVRRAAPGRVRRLFCTNYLVAEDQLRVDDRTVFTAIELATAVPMWNGPLCERLLSANDWARAYVPGWQFSLDRARNAPPLPRGRVARAVERGAALGGEALDRGLLGVWDRFWNRKYAHLDEATRAQRFKRTPARATNHFDDFQFRVIDAWRQRLDAAGIAEPECPESTA